MDANRKVSSSLVGFEMIDVILLGLHADVHQQRGVAAVVEDHVRALVAPNSKMRCV